jgi:hypothetical protein
MRSRRTHWPAAAKTSMVNVPALGPNANTVAGILRLEQLTPVHVPDVSSKMLCPDATAGPIITRAAARDCAIRDRSGGTR